MCPFLGFQFSLTFLSVNLPFTIPFPRNLPSHSTHSSVTDSSIHSFTYFSPAPMGPSLPWIWVIDQGTEPRVMSKSLHYVRGGRSKYSNKHTHIYNVRDSQVLGEEKRKPGMATEKAGEEGAISLRLLRKVSFKKGSLELRPEESEA